MKRSFVVFMTVCLCFFILLCGCTVSDEEEEMSVIVITRVSRQTTSTSDTVSTSTSSTSPSTTTTATSSATTKWTSSTTTTTTATTTTIKLPSTEDMLKDLKGLNVLALGDSLFRGTAADKDKGTPDVTGEKVWINRLAKQCDWNITNLGIAGMTVSLTNTANKVNGKQSMYDKLFNTTDYVYGTTNSVYYTSGDTNKSVDEVDVIFLEGGCNDFTPKNNVPLGTLNSKDKDTFLGAWNLITEKLMKDYPNAAIIFLTTWELDDWTMRTDKITSWQYSTSVKTLYEENYAFRKRITLIDMGDPAVSGAKMNDANWRSQYAFDRHHLKEAGMNVVCTNMLSHIWKALKETGTL